jgi:benzodiazapine receptor
MKPRTLAATSAAVTATAVVGGIASASPSSSTWYRTLRKTPFQPPPAVFPIVWPALYALIAGASAEAIDASPVDQATAYSRALALNPSLHAGWTWLFFRWHRPLLATAEPALLAAGCADLARRARPATAAAQAALAPYLAWTSFATVLSGSIAWLNRRR